MAVLSLLLSLWLLGGEPRGGTGQSPAKPNGWWSPGHIPALWGHWGHILPTPWGWPCTSILIAPTTPTPGASRAGSSADQSEQIAYMRRKTIPSKSPFPLVTAGSSSGGTQGFHLCADRKPLLASRQTGLFFFFFPPAQFITAINHFVAIFCCLFLTEIGVI